MKEKGGSYETYNFTPIKISLFIFSLIFLCHLVLHDRVTECIFNGSIFMLYETDSV